MASTRAALASSLARTSDTRRGPQRMQLAEHGIDGIHGRVRSLARFGVGPGVVACGPLGERDAQDAVVAVVAEPGDLVVGKHHDDRAQGADRAEGRGPGGDEPDGDVRGRAAGRPITEVTGRPGRLACPLPGGAGLRRAVPHRTCSRPHTVHIGLVPARLGSCGPGSSPDSGKIARISSRVGEAGRSSEASR